MEAGLKRSEARKLSSHQHPMKVEVLSVVGQGSPRHWGLGELHKPHLGVPQPQDRGVVVHWC